MDLRMVHSELGCKLSHGELTEEQRRADPQCAHWFIASRCNCRGRFLQLGEQPAGSLVKRSPFLRQRECARAAFEKTQAETAFQFRDAPGERGFRSARGAGGASKPTMTCDEVEVSERKQVHLFHI